MKKNPYLDIFIIFVYIFLLLPLVVIVFSSLGAKEYLAFPPPGFSFRWYLHIFKVEMFMQSFKISLMIAISASFLALILGIPAAYLFSRFEFIGKDTINAIFMSPLIIPGIVFGLSLLRFFVLVMNLPLLLSLFIGHTVILIPYAIRVNYASLSNLSRDIEEAALSLGANETITFFKIVLPNLKTGIIAALVLSFITSFNNVPIALFLTGPGITTLPIQMMIYGEYYFDPTIAAVSVVLLIITIILIYILEKTIGLTYFTARR